MVRASLCLSAIPIVLFAIVGTLAGKPTSAHVEAYTVRPVEIEGVRAQRMDESTFRRRWDPLAVLPPAIEVRYRERVATRDTDGATESGSRIAARPAASRHRRLQSRRASLDLCQRHGMRKVWSQGRWPTWRCRR